MLALLRKEVNAFLSSLIGYIVVVVFLLMMGLFCWVFPGNIMDIGYAELDILFTNAPIIFMFLVPAVTMRSFSEERRLGTLETLMILPISELQIVFAKYLANVFLVLLSLVPTIVYVYTVYTLGNPVGNIDIGRVLGSYLGLFFLASAFVSIGIFASSLTKNQVVAFLISVFLSFFIWIGLELIASFEWLGTGESFFIYCGINAHYESISRGVIDSRDVIYFLSLILIFILLTKYVISRKM